jgi:peroxiredoxin Q/BCP
MASTDNPEDNKGFAEQNQASFPILSDPSKEMVEAYGVLAPYGFARRWTYYIDGDGIIQKIDKDVDPRTAAADLLANLQELNVPLVQDAAP